MEVGPAWAVPVVQPALALWKADAWEAYMASSPETLRGPICLAACKASFPVMTGFLPVMFLHGVARLPREACTWALHPLGHSSQARVC